MKKSLIFVFVLLLTLAACSDGVVVSSNQKSFIGGTTGLLINFVQGEPPSEVTDGGVSPFTVTVKLENLGETFIAASDVLLTLKGMDARLFGLSGPDKLIMNPFEDLLSNDINPDTGETINSPAVYVTFPQMNYKSELSGNSPFPFVINVCYKYRTKATSQLCVKENLLDSSDTSVCTVTGSKTVQNSGGPVQITSFEEFSAGQDAISFSFTVKDVGNGDLSAAGSTCDDTPTAEDYVLLTVDTGLIGLTCSGLSEPTQSGTSYSGTVKLTTGQRQVRCTQQLSAIDKTDKVMIVDLSVDYDYEESASTTVLVKHI